MRGVWTLYRRELAGLFFSPLAWVLLCAALALNGLFFLKAIEQFRGDVDATFQFVMGGSVPFWILVIFLPPLLTMRMISEESRSGMLEFLLTAPVSDWAVVVGKFLAALSVMVLLWLGTFAYGLLIQLLGTAPDWPALLGAFVGSVLVSALFCSLGLFVSACTSTPLLAAFLAFIVNVLVLLLPFLVVNLRSQLLGRLVEPIDVLRHFQSSFQVGVLDTGVVVFFAAWSAAFLFLAARVVEARRWL
jgi:ABC-2 type transport system permease protein